MCDVNFQDDVEIDLTLPEIEDGSMNVNQYELPQKSKKLYEKLYGQFMEWRRTKNITSFSESVLLVYFEHLSDKMKPPTLWTFFSILKSTLKIKHRIDISMYRKLHMLLKRKSEGYKGKKSKTFSHSEMRTFINEAPDERYLLVKVALILGIMGACRRHELRELKLDDVKDLGSALLVTIPNTNKNTTRTFTVTGKYYEICKSYMMLRPRSCSSSSFFVNYQSGRCTVQNVGINKFGNMGKEIATYLNLPDSELYTGHCFRRSSVSLLVDARSDVAALKEHDGWRPSAIVEACLVPEMESADEVEIKEEPFHAELASAELKLEIEAHPLSHLHLNDEDPVSSMDESNEDIPQTETSRSDTNTEDKHGSDTSNFFQCTASGNEGSFATRNGTDSCEREDALDAGVLRETELTTAAIAGLNNRHASSHENIRKRPDKRTSIPDFETEESRQLSTPDLQRLLLVEQLRLTRLQAAFYEKRMKTLPQ